jgi:hypothetical protein
MSRSRSSTEGEQLTVPVTNLNRFKPVQNESQGKVKNFPLLICVTS